MSACAEKKMSENIPNLPVSLIGLENVWWSGLDTSRYSEKKSNCSRLLGTNGHAAEMFFFSKSPCLRQCASTILTTQSR